MKTINGSKFELTCREARSAIRKAPGVFAGVILIEGGDPTYIQVSKTTALNAFRDNEDGDLSTVHVQPDGNVYIN